MRSFFISKSSFSSILLFCCTLFSWSVAQEKDALQKLSSYLPNTTFFLANVSYSAQLLTQMEQLPSQKFLQQPDIQKMMALFFKEFFGQQQTPFLDPSFKSSLSFLEQLDQGISLVAFSQAETKKNHFVLVARSSNATKMQSFNTSLTTWLLGDDTEQIRVIFVESLKVQEIQVHRKSYFYSIINETFIASEDLESLTQIAPHFQPNNPQKNNSLSTDASFLQALQDVNYTTQDAFFLYHNFEKIRSFSSSEETIISSWEIQANEQSAIGALRTLSTAQNQFQNSCIKDRDLDGVGEYGYFTELSGILPIPVGNHEGSQAKPSFLNASYGRTSLQNQGIAQHKGYYFLIYLPGKEEAIRETGKVVPPNHDNDELREEINAQETRWVCYAWPIERGRTGNKSFVVSQYGFVCESKNANYQGMNAIPSASACFDKNEEKTNLQNILADLGLKGNSQDGFEWKEANSVVANTARTREQSDPFFKWIQFFSSSEANQLGLDQLQTLSVSVTLKDQKIKDKVVFRFKEKSKLLSLFSKGLNSYQSAKLSLPKSVLYGSLKLTPEEITKFLLEMAVGKSNVSNLQEEFQKNFKFSLMNDFFGLIGDEISFFLAPPQYGLIPNGAILVSLNQPETFFANVETLIKSQERYALKNTDYLNHRIYYLEEMGRRYSFFTPCFTYLKGNLVISYDPATIKMMIKLQAESKESFADTQAWQYAQAQTQKKHQGVLFLDTKEIFLILYNIFYQIALIFPNIHVADLPLPEDFATVFHYSATWIDCTDQTFSLTSSGDGFGPGSLGLSFFESYCLTTLSNIYSNVSRKGKRPLLDSFSESRERVNHSKCKSNLRQLAVSLQLFVDARGKGSMYPPPHKVKFISMLYRSEVMLDESIYVCPSTGQNTSGELLHASDPNCTDYEGTEYAIWSGRNAQDFPILWDKLGNHPDGKRNVVFLDCSAKTLTEEEFQAMMKKHQEWVEANKDAMLRAKEKSEKFFEGKF